MTGDRILIIDYGSQYTQLIARRIREAGVYCEIHPFNTPLAAIRALAPRAVVLSGGPASVYGQGAPRIAPDLFTLGVPILGICYGLQLTAFLLGGKVERSNEGGEYGRARVRVERPSGIFGRFEAGSLRQNESFSERMRKLYFDTVLYTEEALRLLIKTVGPERCLFGSECPGVASHVHPDTGRQMDDIAPCIQGFDWLSEAEKKMIFEDNSRKVFNLTD